MSVLCVSMKHSSPQLAPALLNYSIIKDLYFSLRSYMIAINHTRLKQPTGSHSPIIKPAKHTNKAIWSAPALLSWDQANTLLFWIHLKQNLLNLVPTRWKVKCTAQHRLYHISPAQANLPCSTNKDPFMCHQGSYYIRLRAVFKFYLVSPCGKTVRGYNHHTHFPWGLIYSQLRSSVSFSESAKCT